MEKKETVGEQQERENEQTIFDYTMQKQFVIQPDVNTKTGWDVESEEEKQERKDNEPGHWNY